MGSTGIDPQRAEVPAEPAGITRADPQRSPATNRERQQMELPKRPRQLFFDDDISVRPDELIEGEVYFWIGYEDDKLTIPRVEPMRYLGASSLEGDKPAHDFEPLSESDEIHAYLVNQLSWLHTFEGMLQALDRCRQRRAYLRDLES
jgi:hypothetical protein